MQEDFYDEEETVLNDYYSPTDWEKDPFESEEEYKDRIQDQEDLLEYFNE